MRRYDDPIQVRRGLGGEWPSEFWWRGQQWQVGEVLEHWIETGAWWKLLAVGQITGSEPATDQSETTDQPGQTQAAGDLVDDREFWRIEASRNGATDRSGVFDLAFAWATAQWRLVGCVD